MPITENIALLFIQYGIVQGLVLAIWLFMRPGQKMLALFFFSLSYLLFVFLVEIKGWYQLAPHLIWTNVPVWFIIAPLLFLHTEKTITPSEKHIEIKNLLHFLPAFAAVFYMFSFYRLGAPEKIEKFESFYTGSSNTDYVQIAYFIQIIGYVIVGIPKIHGRLRSIKEVNSNSKFTHLQLVSSMYYILVGYIVVALAITLVIKFFATAGWDYYTISFFTLSLTIVIATYLVFNMFFSEQENIVKTNFDDSRVIKEKKRKYSSSSLNQSDMENILNRLEEAMKTNQLYKNPELKLSDLATASNIPSHHISQTLNQLKETSFFTYVNRYRVKAVIEKLNNNQHHTITLLAIAEECGFNSQSSFYRIFKSVTGHTPNSYLKSR
jgi:AraC-like DNA-binding protein